MNLVKLNIIKIIDCDTFINVFNYFKVYNDSKEEYHLLNTKALMVSPFTVPTTTYRASLDMTILVIPVSPS